MRGTGAGAAVDAEDEEEAADEEEESAARDAAVCALAGVAELGVALRIMMVLRVRSASCTGPFRSALPTVMAVTADT